MRKLAFAGLWALVSLVGCESPREGADAGGPAEEDSGTVTTPDAGAPVEPELGGYSEFLAPAAIVPTLPSLAARGATLQLAVPNARIGDPELVSLLGDAEAAGVEVALWPLLSEAEGYWPNEANLSRFADEVIRLLDWLEGEGISVAAVVYDLEPAFAYSEALRARLADAELDPLTTLMQSHVDRTAFAQSRDALTEHVREVQARGYRAQAVTFPQVVDDFADGDADLQDAFDIPVDGVPFDRVSFMVYQTVFVASPDAWLGPGLVAAYAADAVTHFGDRATIALGLVGDASVVELDGPRYASPDVLRDDIGAALGAGVTRVEVYSLDGMVDLAAVDGWLAATRAVPRRVRTPAGVTVIRSLMTAIDTSLDEVP